MSIIVSIAEEWLFKRYQDEAYKIFMEKYNAVGNGLIIRGRTIKLISLRILNCAK